MNTGPLDPDVLSTRLDLIAGMPQLSYSGLSENWLWKECGHLHWHLLARAHGQPHPAFFDSFGNRLYAAFIEVSLTDGQLDAVDENDRIRIDAGLSRLSRIVYRSTHTVSREDQPIARLEMTSIFMKRHASNNLTVESDQPTVASRLAVAGHGLVAEPPPALPARTADGATLADLRPCIYNDFNGARFMYFAAFQALADRCEPDLVGPLIGTTLARRIDYKGNINPGDRVAMTLVSSARQGDRIDYLMALRRTDGSLLARIEVAKRILRMV